jgi:HSP20 family protein
MTAITRKEFDRELAWDPFRLMREMFRWDPFRQMTTEYPRYHEGDWMPAFEVRENKDGFVFKADLPGIKLEDLDISMTGNRLTITGKRDQEKETKEDRFYAFERSYGWFTRVFTLPDSIDVEHLKSELKDGVWTLFLPKKAEVLPKKIPVATMGVKS